jgi:hypothetical protein
MAKLGFTQGGVLHFSFVYKNIYKKAGNGKITVEAGKRGKGDGVC